VGCRSLQPGKETVDNSRPSAATHSLETGGTENNSGTSKPSRKRESGQTAVPITNLDGEKVYQLPKLSVHEDFRMSFGFGIKMVKDGLSQKVLVMYVDSINPESDAQKQGLETEMRIIAIDGKPVTDFDATFNYGSELNRIFSHRDPGATVSLEVMAVGSQSTKTIQIMERAIRWNAPSSLLF
jgi:S1-C subfamily serine protease